MYVMMIIKVLRGNVEYNSNKDNRDKNIINCKIVKNINLVELIVYL